MPETLPSDWIKKSSISKVWCAGSARQHVYYGAVSAHVHGLPHIRDRISRSQEPVYFLPARKWHDSDVFSRLKSLSLTCDSDQGYKNGRTTSMLAHSRTWNGEAYRIRPMPAPTIFLPNEDYIFSFAHEIDFARGASSVSGTPRKTIKISGDDVWSRRKRGVGGACSWIACGTKAGGYDFMFEGTIAASSYIF